MKPIPDNELATILKIHIGKEGLASSDCITNYTPHNRHYTITYINRSDKIDIIDWEFVMERGTIMDSDQILYGYEQLVGYLTNTMRRPVTKKAADPSIKPSSDPVNSPKHYTSHPSGIECIQITEGMSFCLGNAIKYIWRADLKENAMQDLEKAKWYIDREISRRNRVQSLERKEDIS